MRTFVSLLLRWLSARTRGSRQVHFRLKEAEFPAASQSAFRLFESSLGDSHAPDGASIDALRPFNNWIKPKDQHELLFFWETLAPVARRIATEGRLRTLSGPAGRIESAKKDILAAAGRIFWKRRGGKESSYGSAQRYTAYPAGAET